MFSFLDGICFNSWQVFSLICACLGVVFSFLNVVAKGTDDVKGAWIELGMELQSGLIISGFDELTVTSEAWSDQISADLKSIGADFELLGATILEIDASTSNAFEIDKSAVVAPDIVPPSAIALASLFH